MVVASPPAASDPAPVHWSAICIIWPCCWGTTEPVILPASASYCAAAAASDSSSTFGQPGPVTVCDPNGLLSGGTPTTRLPSRKCCYVSRDYRRFGGWVCTTIPG